LFEKGTSEKIMRQRSFIGFTLAGIVVLLLVSISGCSWLPAKSPLSPIASTSQPGAAIFVSKQAPAMVSILVNPEGLLQVTGNGVSKLKTSLLANTDLDYQEDIQPWLGKEITLAVNNLDIDRDPENGQQPGYLMALATDNPKESREFVDLLFSKRVLAGANLTVEQYNGVKLIYDDRLVEKTAAKPKKDFFQNPTSGFQSALAGAVVGDEFVLFANDPKVLREAINNVQAPDLNLSSATNYQQAIKQLPKGSAAMAFLNLPTVADWQGFKLTQKIYDSQIVSLALPSKGLLAETSLFGSEEIAPSEQLSEPVGALEYIPGRAGMAISGLNLSNLGNSDLAQLWKQLTAVLSGSSGNLISQLAQPLADIQKNLGINFSQDIFSWVQGEYAIALLPNPEQTTPDWVFVAQKSDGTANGISRLDTIASSKGLTVSSLNLDNQKISAWTELVAVTNQSSDPKQRKSISIEAKAQGVHTTVGNYEIFTNNLETMNEALHIQENSLTDNRNFLASIANIPRPNQGYVYLDWTNSQELVEQQIPILKLAKIVGKPFFDNLRSLTVSSYGNQTGLLKGGIFFQLDKN
jgi:hypothetical protein